jgi:protein-tyrosine phosphatase
MTGVLVLCTANICRSPMAAVLLARDLCARGAVSVRSAGMIGDGEAPAPLAVSAMADWGLDISAHRSRRVQGGDLAAADLTLAMARAHLRHAVVTAPDVWPRAFTLKELVRRGEQIGPRPPGTELADWLALAHDGRDRTALLGDSPDDDIADPIGGPPQAFAATAALLSDLAGRLADLCWPRPGARAPGRSG